MFFEEQVKNASLSPYGRRYSPDCIRWAIELYCRSPAAYGHIRQSEVLALPCASTIKNYRNYITPEPGLNKMAIDEIDRMVKKHGSLDAYLTLDEMKVRENLVVRGGKLVGFVDSAVSSDAVPKLASHILVFYVRSIKREISLPLAWYPTHTTPAGDLAFCFWDLLWQCETLGVCIHAVVADGAPINRKFFSLIASPCSLGEVYAAPNPYGPDRPIFLLSDPSHLLKTARNSLFSSKPGGAKYMNLNGQDILWTHVLQLYNAERATLALQRTRLTDAHIKLNPRSKMSVGLAKDLLSWKVGQCLKTIPGAEGTSNFILMMDKWFDIACSGEYPIWNMQDSRLDWLRHFTSTLLDWKRDAESRKEPKRMLALPTLVGLVFTSVNFIALCERLLQHYNFVCLHSFTQDVLEAFFGNLVKRISVVLTVIMM